MTSAGRARDGRSARRGPAVLLALPTALWYLLFLVAPLVVLVVMSVGERSPNGGYAPGFTFTQYAALPTRFTPFVNTLGLAALNTAICAIVAFPLAYTLATQGPRHVEARPCRPRRHPALDELPHPDLRLDVPAGRQRHPARSWAELGFGD